MRIEMIDFGIEHASFLVTELCRRCQRPAVSGGHMSSGEVGTVINGELTIDIDGEVFELKTGDSVYVKAHTRGTAIISLVTTGICGFVLLLFPPYPVVFAIHCIWGITSILTFWSALVKGNPFPGEF